MKHTGGVRILRYDSVSLTLVVLDSRSLDLLTAQVSG